MKFTLSWLKDHLDTSASVAQIADALVCLGLEVESLEDPSAALQGFVVAQVASREKHPNADRLSLCQVDDGSGAMVQVVCGAPNVRAGMKVAFARVGQVIPITGEALKKGRIRDVDSCGMLCSSRELNLGDDHDGIMDLETDAQPGTPLTNVLSVDPVIELSITPNRGDCFGVRGIARELAALGLGTLKPLTYPKTEGQGSSAVSVTLADTKACPYFIGRTIRGVKNGPSPLWVQDRLKAIGLRPISALVDMTNYLSFDLGRPLHVFDVAKVQGNLTVRLTQKGETLDALNEKTYTLDDGMIAIADDAGVLALGGIMGGVQSGCTDETTDVFIECAIFDPIRIAHTGRQLNLISDARSRFERGIDPAAMVDGIHAATQLILDWCGGVPSEIVFAGQQPRHEKTITLTIEQLKSLSGQSLPLSQIEEMLNRLGFKTVELAIDRITVETPSWRHDVMGWQDLVEEILRLIGYDHIEAVSLTPPTLSAMMDPVEPMLKRLLASRGLYEVVTWSFISESQSQLFAQGQQTLQLANPISQDLSVMRPSLIPSLLSLVSNNQARGQDSFGLFELGAQFSADKSQATMLSGVRVGTTGPRHWGETPRHWDAFDVKADVIAVLDAMGLSGQLETKAPDYYHPGRSATIRQGNKVLAYLGELHPQVLMALDLKGPIVAFEIVLDALTLRKSKANVSLSPYQSVERDFAFVLDRHVPAENVIRAVQKVDKQLITAVCVFDLYEGDKIAADKKSLALQVKLQPTKATLTDADIQAISDQIIQSVQQTTGGVLRQ